MKMEKEDLIYLCTAIGNLSGIPIRIYQNDERIFYYALVDLPKDPMIVYQNDIWTINSHVGYYATPFFHYYGIINYKEYKIIVGPTFQLESTEHELRNLAFQADIPVKEVDRFIMAMKNIVHMPLSSVLQMLCTFNFALNREKLTLEDITIYESEQRTLDQLFADRMVDNRWDDNQPEKQEDVYTSYSVEQKLMDIISMGQTAALKDWLSTAPAIRPGILSADYLRQLKNIFIVSATLASRAAIRGGLDAKTSFSLSDVYIQQMEHLHNPDQITNLQYHMIMDYTERVERIRIGDHPTQLAIQVANYVQNHLYESITVNQLSSALYISRSRLTARFKKETGMTLTDFITKEKMKEAKRLLQFTSKSLEAISDYLAFSSQSHFSRVFKKCEKCAPGEYRRRVKLLSDDDTER